MDYKKGDEYLIEQNIGVQHSALYRSTPNIHGVGYDSIENLKKIVLKTINSPSGNPLIFFKEQENKFDIIHG